MAKPIYASVSICWKDSQKQEDVTISLVEEINDQGVPLPETALFCKTDWPFGFEQLTKEDNNEDFYVDQIYEIYTI